MVISKVQIAFHLHPLVNQPEWDWGLDMTVIFQFCKSLALELAYNTSSVGIEPTLTA